MLNDRRLDVVRALGTLNFRVENTRYLANWLASVRTYDSPESYRDLPMSSGIYYHKMGKL